MSEYRNRSRPQARKMTRAHFEAIAETLRANRPEGEGAYAQWVAMVGAFAGMCAMSNGRFERNRFYVACGLEE